MKQIEVNKEKILKRIHLLRKNESELYSYLVSTAKSSNLNGELNEIFEPFLSDQSSDIRKAAIFSILYCAKSTTSKYSSLAIECLSNEDEESDLRIMSAASIGQAFFNTQDVSILNSLYSLFINRKKDLIATACFIAMLRIIGLSARDTFLRDLDQSVELDAKIINEFDAELSQIKDMIDAI